MSHLYSDKTRARSQRAFAVTASAVALLASMPMAVQAADAPQAAQAEVEEIVVTGSRIVRDGFEAPTPVTVVGVEQFEDAAKTNIADVLNMLPAFQGSPRLANGSTSLSGGNAGTNSLNLRGMGTERTLVLFDGRRAARTPEVTESNSASGRTGSKLFSLGYASGPGERHHILNRTPALKARPSMS